MRVHDGKEYPAVEEAAVEEAAVEEAAVEEAAAPDADLGTTLDTADFAADLAADLAAALAVASRAAADAFMAAVFAAARALALACLAGSLGGRTTSALRLMPDLHLGHVTCSRWVLPSNANTSWGLFRSCCSRFSQCVVDRSRAYMTAVMCSVTHSEW